MTRPILLTCQGLAKAYGTRTLFDDLSLGLFEDDHACLVGPNGSGKSTLLKILAGFEAPDRGTRALRGGLRIGYVAQDPVFPARPSVCAMRPGRSLSSTWMIASVNTLSTVPPAGKTGSCAT